MKQETLRRIEREIEAGDWGKARDRLHGLLVTYPDDLTLRRRLGEVYGQLHYPAMAGRYWYLEEDRTPDMDRACAAFERACGHDEAQILMALKFNGGLAALGDTYAGRTLLALQEQVRQERGYQIEFGKKGAERYRYTEQAQARGRWLLIGCLAAALVAAALMVTGLVAVVQWVF
jgi:hypothetical protein